jgi:hypothetical protein
LSAFSTFQQGWPESFAQWFEQRCNLTAMTFSFRRRPRPYDTRALRR